VQPSPKWSRPAHAARSTAGGHDPFATVQDFWIGGRQGYAQYQYTLLGEDWDEVSRWITILRDKLRQLPELKDVATYAEDRGLEAELRIDRDRAAQLGLSPKGISEALYNAFGQRQIVTLSGAVDQFPIVLEVDADRQGLDALAQMYVKSESGDQVPLRASTRAMLGTAPIFIPTAPRFRTSPWRSISVPGLLSAKRWRAFAGSRRNSRCRPACAAVSMATRRHSNLSPPHSRFFLWPHSQRLHRAGSTI